jgi:antitoxin VapB
MVVAKVFQDGQSQAIRLPKEFQVDATEVYLKRTPEGFHVILRDPWEMFHEGIKELSDEFLRAGRAQPELEHRK